MNRIHRFIERIDLQVKMLATFRVGFDNTETSTGGAFRSLDEQLRREPPSSR